MIEKEINGFMIFDNGSKIEGTLIKNNNSIFFTSSDLSIKNNDFSMQLQIGRISTRFVMKSFLVINDNGNELLFFPNKYPELLRLFDQNQTFNEKYLLKINWLVTFFIIWGYISVKYSGTPEISISLFPFVLLFPIFIFLLETIYYQKAAEKFKIRTSTLEKSFTKIIIEYPNKLNKNLFFSILLIGFTLQLFIISIIIANENILFKTLDIIIFISPSIIIGKLFSQIG